MSISHPWPRATGKYAARGPHYVALGPHDAALGPRAIALRASGGIMGASGDIMFGPWAAYFPVSLGLGCDIVPLFTIFMNNQLFFEHNQVEEMKTQLLRATEVVPLRFRNSSRLFFSIFFLSYGTC